MNYNNNYDNTLQQRRQISLVLVAVPRPGFIEGPPEETKPDYENIHGPLGKQLDIIFLKIFRAALAEQVGVDSSIPHDEYDGLMELARALNSRYSDRTQIQQVALQTLQSLFPSWLPGAYSRMFSGPFPEFSARMNAAATLYMGQWLMGECELNDDGGKVGQNQGLLVKRCRFLEESGCASICVNSCKIPTQRFFNEDMGLPMRMTPDYETGECQFSFGLSPTETDDLQAMTTPCLAKCPSAGGLRSWHNNNGYKETKKNESNNKDDKVQCSMMGVDG